MLAKLSRRRQFAIPKKLADSLHLKEGDFLKVEKKENSLVITPVEIEERFDPEMLAKAEQALEQNLEEGKTFSSFSEMMRELRKHKKSSHGKK